MLLIIVYIGDKIFGVESHSDRHYAIIFNAFVWCQLFNEVNCRKVNDGRRAAILCVRVRVRVRVRLCACVLVCFCVYLCVFLCAWRTQLPHASASACLFVQKLVRVRDFCVYGASSGVPCNIL